MPWNLAWDYSYDSLPNLRTGVLDVRFLWVCTIYLLILGFASWVSTKRKSHLGAVCLIRILDLVNNFTTTTSILYMIGQIAPVKINVTAGI